MIIHADMMINGLLRVEKFDDCLVLTNPGLLKLPIEQIYVGGESKARNQHIQTMFRLIGYGENIGSGFPLIINAWNEKHWLKPELIEQPELLQVKLILHIDNAERNNVFNQADDTKDFPKDFPKELSERQKLILTMIIEDNTITSQKISQKISPDEVVTSRTIKKDLAVLQQMGVIKREGGRKQGHWVIISSRHLERSERSLLNV